MYSFKTIKGAFPLCVCYKNRLFVYTFLKKKMFYAMRVFGLKVNFLFSIMLLKNNIKPSPCKSSSTHGERLVAVSTASPHPCSTSPHAHRNLVLLRIVHPCLHLLHLLFRRRVHRTRFVNARATATLHQIDERAL